jgi:hypothetical protein
MRNTEHTRVYCQFYCQFYFHWLLVPKSLLPGNFHLWNMQSFLGCISRLPSKNLPNSPPPPSSLSSLYQWRQTIVSAQCCNNIQCWCNILQYTITLHRYFFRPTPKVESCSCVEDCSKVFKRAEALFLILMPSILSVS